MAPFAQFDEIVGEIYFERTCAMFLEPFAQFFDHFQIRILNRIIDTASVFIVPAVLARTSFRPCPR